MGHRSAEAVLYHLDKMLAARRAEELADELLLERFAGAGDEAAFAALVERYGGMVLGVCRRVLERVDEGEDAFQATFLVLARKARTIRKRQALASWLFGVAHRLALKARTKAVERRNRERQVPDRPLSNPVDDLSWREVRQILDDELARLPEKHRAPLLLCYLDGLTQDEAARRLNWPRGTLKRRLERGRELLRARLSRRGVSLSATLLLTGLSANGASASVPPLLAISTLRAAMGFALGSGMPVGSVSVQAATLAEGMLRNMLAIKVKTGVTAVLAITMLAGAGLGGFQWSRAKPQAVARVPDGEKKRVGEKADDSKKTREEHVRSDLYGDPLPPGAIARMGTVRFRDHPNNIAYSLDEKTLIASDWEVRVWDAVTGRQLRRMAGHNNRDKCFVAPDQKTVAWTTNEGSIELWDYATGMKLRSWESQGMKGLPAKERRINTMVFSPDSRMLATAGPDGILRLWNAATGEELRQLTGPKAFEQQVALSPDGRKIAYGHADKTVRVCETTSGEELWRTAAGPDGICWLAFSPDGKVLASSLNGRERPIYLWDAATGKELRQLTPNAKEGFSQVAFAPDSKTLAIGDHDGTILLFELATGKQSRRIRAHCGYAGPLAFSSDGKTLVSCGDNLIRQWDVATGMEVHAPAGPAGSVCFVALSPDGRTLASGNSILNSRLWDAKTGKELHHITEEEAHGWRILAFSPDGRTLVQQGQQIIFWEVASGKERQSFLPPTSGGAPGNRQTLSFSADGTLLASGNGDSTVLIWDVAGRLNPKPGLLSAKDLQAHWAALVGDDAIKADQAIWALMSVPEQTVPFLQKQLQPAQAADQDQLGKLLADLDSNQFEARKQAALELEKFGELAEPAFQKVLAGKPTAEVKRQVARLREKLWQANWHLSGERLRQERALEVLEHIGNPAARSLLERLAQGTPEARLTKEAKVTVERLTRRATAGP
jgi:RNA polymerase sigma factor (sigma-70 family)